MKTDSLVRPDLGVWSRIGGVSRVLAACAAIAFPCMAQAATETVNGIPWTYVVENGKAELFNDSSSVIPALRYIAIDAL